MVIRINIVNYQNLLQWVLELFNIYVKYGNNYYSLKQQKYSGISCIGIVDDIKL